MLKKGDRVKYVGTDPFTKGLTGVVEEVMEFGDSKTNKWVIWTTSNATAPRNARSTSNNLKRI